jgi:hypothetical protein
MPAAVTGSAAFTSPAARPSTSERFRTRTQASRRSTRRRSPRERSSVRQLVIACPEAAAFGRQRSCLAGGGGRGEPRSPSSSCGYGGAASDPGGGGRRADALVSTPEPGRGQLPGGRRHERGRGPASDRGPPAHAHRARSEARGQKRPDVLDRASDGLLAVGSRPPGDRTERMGRRRRPGAQLRPRSRRPPLQSDAFICFPRCRAAFASSPRPPRGKARLPTGEPRARLLPSSRSSTAQRPLPLVVLGRA